MTTMVSQESVVASVSRTGRDLQRYRKGRRQVVGCIPYRYIIGDQTSLGANEELEVLVITSKKGKRMLFPKGGWEMDESKKEAALRETIEEAGVRGIVEGKLGKWRFKGKNYGYEGYMFPLLVQEQFEIWPEQSVRQRTWMNVSEAREVCQQRWMKEALERLVDRLKGHKLDDVKELVVVGSVQCTGDANSD
ncbi:putative hydrolase [Medicago truncatula]|uniref:Nudix hydrolase-like protein n=1 Tax=Medicago truncatula TaxID=3880 RepID=G7KG37_MEDTR|nr:nudix hydrolase 18, mitochondrial [Medicago truncatula]AES99224.1 nudix hydrolase-like protein [Medicago truncatula]RHN56905.1 putative hydrolase [Medicago truncatula]